jgi:two-component system NtrC family response regulator
VPERVLVVDDDASLRRVLEYNLAREGYAVLTADSGERALALLETERVDLVITDIKMPGMDGMDLLRRVRQASPETQVIVITAFGTIEMAVEAMKAGAFEYVTKPFKRDELSLAVRKALRLKSLESENARLKREVGRKYGFENIVGDSPALQQVFRLIEKVADSDAPVLITGESGTGKELVAKAIHYRSARADRPFVAVNCAAIPRELLESELFGHRRGAFTGAVRDKKGRFEEAGGGTLLLDEIAELPLELQPKLLRALQEREIAPVGGTGVVRLEARVIAATNRDLEGEVAQGRFRSDLYYRLAVVPLRLPALRERPGDIPLLVAHFLRTLGGGRKVQVAPEAMEALQRHPWRGNVRELENTVERLLVLGESDLIRLADLPEGLRAPRAGGGPGGPGFSFVFPEEGISLEEAEKALVLEALRRSGWNQSRAAQLLRVPRHLLLYRMEKYGLPRRPPEGADGASP